MEKLDASKPQFVRSNARVGFRVDRTDSSFKVQKNLHPFLQTLWLAEPSIRILPTNPNLPELVEWKSLPKNVNTLQQYFTIVEEKLPNTPKRVYVNFQLLAPTTINNLKRIHPLILQYLQTHRIHFTHDVLTATHHTSIGHLFHINPRTTWLPGLHQEIVTQLTTLDITNYSHLIQPTTSTTKPTPPNFQLLITPVYHNTGPNLITTTAIGIHCSKLHGTLLTAMFSDITIPRGTFVPHGITTILGNDNYRNMLFCRINSSTTPVSLQSPALQNK
jgi:hypothetical protein